MTISIEQLKQQIMTFLDGDPNENPWVKGKPQPEQIDVVKYNNEWPLIFTEQKQAISNVLANQFISIEHVGSTAVPTLAAKPVIDIDLIVQSPNDESRYLAALESLGYELTVRELSWYQHRMLRLAEPRVNLHIFPQNCPEHIRHLLFRDWLITHPKDCALYEETKLSAKMGTNDVVTYNLNKNEVVKQIYQHIFAELDTLLPALLITNN